jgi:hypothetical protein
MKKLKHSKYRNTGLLFDVLSRAVMHEAVNPDKPQNAMRIIRKHFVSGSELLAELMLYRTLSGTTENDPQALLELSISARRKLNRTKLEQQRYDLVRSIKSKYDIDSLLESKVTDYKLQASIFKLLEYDGTDNPDEYLSSKRLVMETLSGKQVEKAVDEVEQIWRQQEPDIRKIGFKLLVEKFNEKYRELGDRQKKLLSRYINADHSNPEFRDFVLNEVGYIGKKLSSISSNMQDPVTKIKLDETINLLQSIVVAKNVNEDHLSAMLKYYELIEEFNDENDNIRTGL